MWDLGVFEFIEGADTDQDIFAVHRLSFTSGWIKEKSATLISRALVSSNATNYSPSDLYIYVCLTNKHFGKKKTCIIIILPIIKSTLLMLSSVSQEKL